MEDEAEIRRARQDFVTHERAAEWVEAAAVFAESAIRMVPNAATLEGRSAILKDMESGDFQLDSFALTPVTIAGDGAIAVERGRYFVTFTPPGASSAVSDSGKYLAAWGRTSDGAWLITEEIWNSDVPIGPEMN